MKYVIIGNGIAGINAIEAIRELDQAGEIVLVGDETVLPYSRPMISYVLEGSQPLTKLPIRSEQFYEQLRVTTILGRRVSAIDVDRRQIVLNGARLDFDRLLIAAGADPRPVQAANTSLDNIFYMRTHAHARRQVQALERGPRQAVVLGGGLVGFKAAYALMKRRLKVTMLITSGYPLSMQVDEAAGKMILDRMMVHGLDVRVGVSVQGFEGNGAVRAVMTDTGLSIPCDMVIIGKGVLPARDFIPKDRIDVDLGVVVDDHLQSSVPGIYAAGDVAESIDIARQQRWVNAIWPEAAVQGRTAGCNMAGRPVVYPGSLSRNVMRIYDLDLMTLGYANPQKDDTVQVVRSGGPCHGFYRSLVFRDRLLIGAVLVNRIEQGGVLRALIENRVPTGLSPWELMSPGFNFARLLPG
jgi:NAD(P)H-nitrite reductase large subunit